MSILVQAEAKFSVQFNSNNFARPKISYQLSEPRNFHYADYAEHGSNSIAEVEPKIFFALTAGQSI